MLETTAHEGFQIFLTSLAHFGDKTAQQKTQLRWRVVRENIPFVVGSKDSGSTELERNQGLVSTCLR